MAAWRSVAAGWERRRQLIWAATRPVSERLVELLAPRPGERVLELAAGVGDTGFLAAARLGGEGRLLTTDAAPEMVEAARRRAAELGVDNVDFRVADAAATGLPDDACDGVLCRFGLMLVVDTPAALAEVARVLRPGGRAAIAVWAEPARNDWIAAGGRAALELGLVERPDPDAPGPFRLADESRLTALVEGSGLGIEALEEVELAWRARSVDEWWEVSLDTSRMLSVLTDRIDDRQLAALRAGAAARLAEHVRPDGSLEVPGMARVALLRPPS